MKRLPKLGLALFLTVPGLPAAGYSQPAPGEAETPAEARVERVAVRRLRPVIEGPLHESFLSPRRDRELDHVKQSPPPAVVEQPALDPPSDKAVWIEGYWEWDAGRREFLWVTGSWRVPPPGRFWVNGFWKRDDDGWYRVSGFWSDRETDRIDYRKDGPPPSRPDDDPGQPPETSSDVFYIPGQYHPDGDGVVWKKGFWTVARPGWSWVPASWIRQPEGWVFQDGYWDRTLEGRGTLFAPAEISKNSGSADDLSYQPYTTVSPEMYGQLYGAFGRPNSYYDGYPGVFYDADGRYYGYAEYGNLTCYYGYLDYPYYGSYGYPYYAAPLTYATYGYGGYGIPYYGGLLGNLFGLGFGYPGFAFLPYGYGAYSAYGGYGPYGGYGLGGWGGWGGLRYGLGHGLSNFGGLGWGFPGWALAGFGGGWSGPTWGSPGWGALGFGGFGFPFFGPGSFGFPFYGLSGFGNPFLGIGGFGNSFNRGWNNLPFQNSGRHHLVGGSNNPMLPHHGGAGGNSTSGRGGRRNDPGGVAGAGLPSHGFMQSGPGLASSGAVQGVRPPPSSRPFASLESNNPAANHQPSALQHASMRTASGRMNAASNSSGSWNHAFNGVGRSATIHRSAARPAFTNSISNQPGVPAGNGGVAAQGAGGGHGLAHQGAVGSFIPQMRGAAGAANPAFAAGVRNAAPGFGDAGLGMRHFGSQGITPRSPGFAPQGQTFAGPGGGSFGAANPGAMRGGAMGGGFNGAAAHLGAAGGGLGAGFNGGFNPGGMRGPGFAGGAMQGGAMGGGLGSGFSGGVGGMRGGGFSPASMGGMHGGGFGGGSMGGMGGGMHGGGGMGGGFGGGSMGGMGGGMGGMHGGGHR